jgi:hypothetical protein
MEARDQFKKAMREKRREDVKFWSNRLLNLMVWYPELMDDFDAEPYHRARREELMRRSSRRHLVQDLKIKQAKEDYYATKFFAKSAEVYVGGTSTAGQSMIVGVSSAVTESAYRRDKKGAGRVGKSLAKDAATALLPPGVNVVAGEAFDHTLGRKIENSISNVRTRESVRTQHLMNPLGETDSTFHGPRYSPSGKQKPYK